MQYASSEDYAKYCPGGTVPPEEQDAALDAASRDIDGLTFDRIVAVGFDRLTAFHQLLLKRAVCEQAEFRFTYFSMRSAPLLRRGGRLQFEDQVRRQRLGAVVIEQA